MRTCALQSGSNGNAIYVEVDGVRLMFDAGISGRQAHERLAAHGRTLEGLHAILLSHFHSDHSRCAGVFHRRTRAPVYATPATHRAIRTRCGEKFVAAQFAPGATLQFGPVQVHTLPTPHDAHESVAFVVEHGGCRLGILTDLGHPFAGLRELLATLDAVYLESNYDPIMLAEGPYPPELQARIRGAGGHLSNFEAAELLRDCPRRPQWVALAHLSEHNNDPDLALRTHRAELGPEYPLYLTSRYAASPLWSVRADAALPQLGSAG